MSQRQKSAYFEKSLTSQGPRGSKVYVFGWGIFLAMTVALAVGARTIIVRNQEAIQANIQSHLELILRGSVELLDAQLRGSAAHMQDAVRLIESRLAASPANNQKENLIKLLEHDLRTVSALAIGYQDASGRKFISVSHLEPMITSVRFDGRPLDGNSTIKVDLSLPFRASIDGTNADSEDILALWRAKSAGLSKQGISEIYAFVDARLQLARALQPGRSGTTGELYAFDRNGLMISDSRFNEHLYKIGFLQPGQQAALRVRVSDPGKNLIDQIGQFLGLHQPKDAPLTVMAQSATTGNSSFNLKGFADYRGVPVVGAWKWLDDYGFGITHEVDYAEAYAHIKILNLTFLTLLALLLAAAVAMGFLAWRAEVNEANSDRARNKLEALQRDIHHYNRINTLGQLATGMAHELNQPLTTIVNFARALIIRIQSSKIDDRIEIEKQLSQIEKNAKLSGDIIKRMRGFLRADQRSVQRVSLRQLVSDSYQLLEYEMKQFRVQFAIDEGSDAGWIEGDGVQLQQVILNLMKNSMDAMQSNSTDSRWIKIKTSTSQQNVILDIWDNGPGISSELRPRVFEQFVTTKNGGMGLGLAICDSIVNAHEGSIQLVDSERGAHFQLRFPNASTEHTNAALQLQAAHN